MLSVEERDLRQPEASYYWIEEVYGKDPKRTDHDALNTEGMGAGLVMAHSGREEVWKIQTRRKSQPWGRGWYSAFSMDLPLTVRSRALFQQHWRGC